MKWGLAEMAARVVHGWAVVRLAKTRFLAVDGMEWAAAFSFNAFFSLFSVDGLAGDDRLGRALAACDRREMMAEEIKRTVPEQRSDWKWRRSS